ncbi:hypothetical protein FHG87_021385 [Trinorchestia longiramus]|nr:hypothetical protein FHG87_021385 [Trinorchestia longiramus]
MLYDKNPGVSHNELWHHYADESSSGTRVIWVGSGLHNPGRHVKYTLQQVRQYTLQQVRQYTLQQARQYTLQQVRQYTLQQVRQYTLQQVRQYTLQQVRQYTLQQVRQYTLQQAYHLVSSESEIQLQGVSNPERWEHIVLAETRTIVGHTRLEKLRNLIPLLRTVEFSGCADGSPFHHIHHFIHRSHGHKWVKLSLSDSPLNKTRIHSSVSQSGPYRPPGGVEEMQGGGRKVRLEWGAYITV